MKHICLFGATGPLGVAIVREALPDFEVTAVVRNADRLPLDIKEHANLHINTECDIFDADSLAKVFQGKDAVVSALGYHGKYMVFALGTLRSGEPHFYDASIKAIVEGMRKTEVRRLITVTTQYTKRDVVNHPFSIERIIKPLFLGKVLDDMYRMETYLQTVDDIDFTVCRPPGLGSNIVSLSHDMHTSEEQMTKHESVHPTEMGYAVVNRMDVAHWMLQCLDDQSAWRGGKLVAICYN